MFFGYLIAILLMSSLYIFWFYYSIIVVKKYYYFIIIYFPYLPLQIKSNAVGKYERIVSDSDSEYLSNPSLVM